MSAFNEKKYDKILSLYESEMSILCTRFKTLINTNHTLLNDDILDIFFAKSKRLRPLLVFLIASASGIKIDEDVINIALAVEILHTATLLHDDVIDNAFFRRCIETINHKYTDKIAVLAGDYLTALCIDVLNSINNNCVYKIFSKHTINICKGEINQNFQKYKIPSLEEYLEKSINKTSSLFLAGVESLFETKGQKISESAKSCLLNYCSDFSLCFQIKDDLNNFSLLDEGKTSLDFKEGVYTLPYILFEQQNPSYDIIEKFKDSKNINIAQELSFQYLNSRIDRVIENLDRLNDDIKYKDILIELINLIK